jgi:hypothetical protein
MPGYIRNVTTLLATLSALGLTEDAFGEENIRLRPRIKRHEPMVFDLVRPLGAAKGELEINTLLDYSPRTGLLEWSPEIEYAYAKGYTIELELPVENTTLNQYKVTLQGTFGRLYSGKMIHGWQAIGRRIIDEKVYGADILYLNHYKFSEE